NPRSPSTRAPRKTAWRSCARSSTRSSASAGGFSLELATGNDRGHGLRLGVVEHARQPAGAERQAQIEEAGDEERDGLHRVIENGEGPRRGARDADQIEGGDGADLERAEVARRGGDENGDVHAEEDEEPDGRRRLDADRGEDQEHAAEVDEP